MVMHSGRVARCHRAGYCEECSGNPLAFGFCGPTEVAHDELVVKLRETPSQARSAWTVDLILEAAAQVLEARGEDALTTKTVAERAGVSIGTLYQYFPNRDAILVA